MLRPFDLLLHCDWCLNRGERIVADEHEIVECEIVDVLNIRIDVHRRYVTRLTFELLIRLFEMIEV